MDAIIQRASLIGQVIEDLTYETLSPQRYGAELMGAGKSPQYKNGGYFVFSDLASGDYTLLISGERFQAQKYSVTIPIVITAFGSPPSLDPYPIFDPQGENELAVIVKTVNGGGSRITFDEVVLKKEIRSGSAVVASAFFANLSETLDVGKVSQARLTSVAGLGPGAIVRIIRDRSIRLKFDPYHRFESKLTSIAGNVVPQNFPEVPLEGARVRLTNVNGINVAVNDIAGAKIATIGAGATGVVLGAEKDVITFTNQRGDYSFYFEGGKLTGNATLEVSLAGYQTQTGTIAITELARNRADFVLLRS
jgi:hypothetical protein